MRQAAAGIRAGVERRFAWIARSPVEETRFPVGPASARKLGGDRRPAARPETPSTSARRPREYLLLTGPPGCAKPEVVRRRFVFPGRLRWVNDLGAVLRAVNPSQVRRASSSWPWKSPLVAAAPSTRECEPHLLARGAQSPGLSPTPPARYT
jgi:hypothetical protein